MKEKKWILDSGTTGEESISELVGKYFRDNYCYLAGCTDSYCTGRKDIEYFLKDKVALLLEMRVFSDQKELLVSRSLIGREFSWRIAFGDELGKTDYIDYEQYIDINLNSEKSFKTDTGMNIMSTVGGEYELPITNGENKVMIRAYISYDENGMAKVTDHSVLGFCKG